MKLTIIGAGYVGLVSGNCFAEVGNNVICVDNDKTKIDDLNNGKIPIWEPGLEEMIRRNSEEGRLSFTTNIKHAVENSDICFIAVGTPPDKDASADLALAKTELNWKAERSLREMCADSWRWQVKNPEGY